MSWRSGKFKECSLCHQDTRGNFDPVVRLICAECVWKLRNTPQKRIREAYNRLIEKGNIGMAKLLEGFLEKGESDVKRKAVKFGRKIISGYRRRVIN